MISHPVTIKHLWYRLSFKIYYQQIQPRSWVSKNFGLNRTWHERCYFLKMNAFLNPAVLGLISNLWFVVRSYDLLSSLKARLFFGQEDFWLLSLIQIQTLGRICCQCITNIHNRHDIYCSSATIQMQIFSISRHSFMHLICKR